MDPAPDRLVRPVLFAGWICGLLSLVTGGRASCLLAVMGGALLAVAGVLVATDGGRAMAALNRRYAPWQRAPGHRFIGALLMIIGAGWIVSGAL